MREPLAIVQVGMCCPVGLDSAETASSLRAGVTRMRETGFVDRMFEPIIVGHVDEQYLPPLSPRLQVGPSSLARRMLRLSTLPLREVLTGHRGHAPPLYLAGPQPAPGEPELFPATFVGDIAAQAEQAIDVAASRLFASGRAGLFAAVAAARDELLDGRREFVLVGGVDSYLNRDRLETLEREKRLRTSGPQDSLTPGEAAAFVLLARRATCKHQDLHPLAWIHAVGLGSEPGHRYAKQPCLGDGLAAAFGEVFEQLRAPLGPIRLLLAGQTGERRFAREGGIALLRHRERFDDDLRTEHAAEYIGDAGAGLAPLMLGATAHRMHKGTTTGPALLWGASDHEQRGALILHTEA
jgi:3-oxoacyl-[acyl-carrier-protein] synthase-1